MHKTTSNIRLVQKHFHVTVQLRSDTYNINFRYNEAKKSTEQLSLLKYTLVNADWGYAPRHLPGYLAYLNVHTGFMDIKESQSDNPTNYEGYLLVDYDMFEGAKWTGFFKHPPR